MNSFSLSEKPGDRTRLRSGRSYLLSWKGVPGDIVTTCPSLPEVEKQELLGHRTFSTKSRKGLSKRDKLVTWKEENTSPRDMWAPPQFGQLWLEIVGTPHSDRTDTKVGGKGVPRFSLHFTSVPAVQLPAVLAVLLAVSFVRICASILLLLLVTGKHKNSGKILIVHKHTFRLHLQPAVWTRNTGYRRPFPTVSHQSHLPALKDRGAVIYYSSGKRT